MICSAISEVVKFPVRNQIILGGNPLSTDISKKSASNVTTVKSYCLANCHIFESLQSFRPTDRTWRQSEKLSGSKRKTRNDIFWPNSNFILNILQRAFSLSSKSKACKNILPSQFRKIGKNIVVGHTGRQPPKYVINRYSSFSNTRFPKTFFGIDSDSVIKNIHNLLLRKHRQNYKKSFILQFSFLSNLFCWVGISRTTLFYKYWASV